MKNDNKFLGTITKSGDYGEKRKTSFHPDKSESSTIRTTILSEGGELLVFHEKTKGANMLRIRKLTEGECYRLMGFQKKDHDACKDAGQSAANVYHQAGDSIVTTVLVGIFGQLIGVDPEPVIRDYAKKLHEETISK